MAFTTKHDPYIVNKMHSILREHNIIIPPLVDVALNLGGYIAGGFARFVVFHELLTEQARKTFFVSQSDIDVWFEDKETLDKFLKYVDKPQLRAGHFEWTSNETMSGSGIEYVGLPFATAPHDRYPQVFSNELAMKIQVLSKFLGPAETTISAFDITNCKVMFKCDRVMFDERIPELERTSTINVDEILSTNTVYRVFKYLCLRDMKNLTPKSSKDIADYYGKVAKEPITEAQNETKTSSAWMSRPQVPGIPIMSRFRALIPYFNINDLMYLSALGFDEYLQRHGYARLFDSLVEKTKEIKDVA